MNYLAIIDMEYAEKNKLNSAILIYLRTINRVLIRSNYALEKFQKEVIESIEKLNTRFPRCKPIIPSWYSPSNENDFMLSGVNVCTFRIYYSDLNFDIH